jgi:hypothetical protein
VEFDLTRPVEFTLSLRVLEFEDEDDDEYEDEAIGALPHTRPPLGERGPRIIRCSISIQLMKNRLFFIAPGLTTDLRITDY